MPSKLLIKNNNLKSLAQETTLEELNRKFDTDLNVNVTNTTLPVSLSSLTITDVDTSGVGTQTSSLDCNVTNASLTTSVSNFPATQNVDITAQTVGDLNVNLNAQTSNILTSSTISDINIPSQTTDLNVNLNDQTSNILTTSILSDINIPSQTTDLNVNLNAQTSDISTINPSIKIAGVDTYTENVTQVSLMGGLRVDNPTATVFPVANNNEIAPLCLNDDGSIYTSCRQFPNALVTNDNLRVDIKAINGNVPPLGNGVNTNSQRVTIANDNDNINVVFPSSQNIQTNGLTDKVQVAIDSVDQTGNLLVEEQSMDKGTGTITSNTKRVTFADEHLDTNNLKVDVQNSSLPVTGTFFQATQPVSVASTLNVEEQSMDKGTGAITSNTKRVTFADEHLETNDIKINISGQNLTTVATADATLATNTTGLNLLSKDAGRSDSNTLRTKPTEDAELKIKNSTLRFSVAFENDKREDLMEYRLVSGAGITETFDGNFRTIDITTTLNTFGNYLMQSKEKFNTTGGSIRIFWKLKPTINGGGPGTRCICFFGSNSYGAYFNFRGDGTIDCQSADSFSPQQVEESSWNINNSFLGDRTDLLIIYCEIGNGYTRFGQVYEGKIRYLHEFLTSNGDQVVSFMDFPVGIQLIATGSNPAWTTEVKSITLHQDFIRDLTPYNNFINVFLENSGSIQATGNYSGAVTDFTYTATTSPTYISRMIILISASGGFTPDEYGDLSALTNGVKTFVERNGTREYLHPQFPITTNKDWAGLCFDTSRESWNGGDDILRIRWTFSKAGAFIRLNKDDLIGVELNDNFSTGTLTRHSFCIQGYSI